MDRSDKYFLNIAKAYFAQWLAAEPADLDRKGLFAKYSVERDKRQKGYGKRFDLYCFFKDDTAIISYSSRVEEKIQDIVTVFEEYHHIEDRKKALNTIFGVKSEHSYKYYFTELPKGLDTSKVAQLTRENYDDFLRFFRKQHPKADPEGWLEAYFNSITDKGYVYGIYEDGLLVSATDAPDMPYMSDLVVEPGIATLQDYRNRGYGKAVVGSLMIHLLRIDKVPIWSCSSTNTASQRLAESVGYRKLADVIALTLKE